jgi:hypothetical protein
VGTRLAGPDETCPAITLAGNAQTAVQQTTTIDLISEIDLTSETAESGVGASPSLASLSDRQPGWSKANASDEPKHRPSQRFEQSSPDRTKAMRISWHEFLSLRKERGSK